MNESRHSGKIKNFILTSPSFLLLFLLVPAITVVRLRLHMQVSGDLLLANNAVFLLCIAGRLVGYAIRANRDTRYSPDSGKPKETFAVAGSAQEIQGELERAGYRFTEGGSYGEKRDVGFFGTMALYAGIFILLATGSYDYMREYSIMIRSGVGEPVSLDGTGLVGQFEAGNLASTKRLPMLQVRKQILPNDKWPKGATEIALVDKERKELAKGTIAPGEPFRYRGLEFHMIRFVFDAYLVILEGRAIVYDNFVKFLPLPEKKGPYSYYGGLFAPEAGPVKGSAWLDPGKKTVKMEATLDGKTIYDGEVELWGKNTNKIGNYTGSIKGMAQWSEIRVARGRHRTLLMLGGVVAAIGMFLRLAIRPQRVWFEQTEEGLRGRAVGAAKKLLNG